MRQIKQIGLIANPEKSSWKANLSKAVKLIEQADRTAVAPQLASTHPSLMEDEFEHDINAITQTDLILVIGGDGTMLSAARALKGANTPILGINTGNLGFLTAAPMADLEKVLEGIWSEDYRILSRPFMEASVKGRDEDSPLIAVNDFVISRGELSRMIQLNVSVDGDFLTTYQCDGLIVCSPTGSTAYSLSAGGPIVSPSTSVMTMTPICPHALSNRSVIVPLHSMIEVEVGVHRPETILTGDGSGVPTLLKPRDIIQIRQSAHHFQILSVSGTNFFQTLRQKMMWSGSNVSQ
jgi:NAD+ kinase